MGRQTEPSLSPVATVTVSAADVPGSEVIHINHCSAKGCETHSHIGRAARPEGEVLLDVPGRVDLGGYLVEAAFGPLQTTLEFEDFHH
jgi:hypothetical protein